MILCLGNDLKTVMGSIDSGGFLQVGNAIIGISTSTKGYGSFFGDFGGSIVFNNEWD